MYRPNLLQRAFNNPLFSTVLYGALWGVLFTAAEHVRLNGYTLMVHIVSSLVFGAFMTLMMQRQLRRYDQAAGITSFEQRIALQHSLKTGELPSEPGLRKQLPGFLDAYEARAAKQQRGNRLVLPFIFVVYVGNALLWHSWWWLLVGALFIPLMLWSFRAQRRVRENIPKLRVAIKTT